MHSPAKFRYRRSGSSLMRFGRFFGEKQRDERSKQREQRIDIGLRSGPVGDEAYGAAAVV